MSKSIELGRAVLSSQATDYELWLTALITVSPRQGATYLQELTSVQCLDFLMSGAVWVNRGHDMHIEMKLKLCEECLSYQQLQDLTNAVLCAPVWGQLMLKPTPRTKIGVDAGTLHLDVHHAPFTGTQEEKRRHRLFSGVPATDIRPPEGITEVSLQSVHLFMDILETSPRRRLGTKRSNSSPGERKALVLEEQDSDILLHEMIPDNLSDDGHINRNPAAPRAAAYRKRKRPTTEIVVSTQSSPANKPERSKRRPKRPTTDTFVQSHPRIDTTSLSGTDVASMVDGALRLSICGTLSKTTVGWKTKASTFRVALADVAPAIWKAGYLVALSQRAHLLPTISRSLAQIGSLDSTSASLRDKIESLKIVAQEASLGRSSGKGSITTYDVVDIESAIARRLWVQSQTSLREKPTAPIQACIGSPPQSDSDDMLAEEEPRWHHFRRTTPFKDNSPREFPNDESTEYAKTFHRHGGLFGSPYLGIDVRGSEDDLLLDSHPRDTMSTTAWPADQQLCTPGSLSECLPSMPLIPIQQSSASRSQHCLETLHTVQLSSDQPTMANPETLHEPLFENDVDCTEELLQAS